MSLSRRTLESAALFAIAFFVTTLVHELAHAVAAVLVGRDPVMFTSSVEYTIDGSVTARVVTKLAGPLFSGISGLVLLLIARAMRGPPRLRLFVLWLGYHGLVNLIGYVFSMWFAPGGDLGAAARLLELPTLVQIGLMLLAFGGLRLVARPFALPLAQLSPTPLTSDAEAKAWSKEIGLFAGFIATPVLMLSFVPVPHWLTFMYCGVSALPLFDLPRAMVRARGESTKHPLPSAAPIPFIVAYVVVVIVARAIFDGGVRL
jgi:hypothetical protein